jgi:ribose transport system ATP-binding protein
VHQDLSLIPNLSVWENLRLALLRQEGRTGVKPRREKAATAEILDRFGLTLDPDALVRDLGRVERAMLAIVRAAQASHSSEAGVEDVLILDEVSAFLPLEERNRLYDLVRGFARRGGSVLYIAHDLNEIFELATSLTILRDGKLVRTSPTADTTIEETVELMVGSTDALQASPVAASTAPAVPRVTVTGLRSRALPRLDLEIGRGEIVGLTGLVGSGSDDVPDALFGADPDAAGSMSVDQDVFDIGQLTPRSALLHGIGLIPADRKAAGGAADLPAYENVTLTTFRQVRHGAVLSSSRLRAKAGGLMREFGVRPPEPRLAFSAFSGGNQQKMILAKWLEIQPRFLVMHEPTQGVDVGARAEILARIRRSAAAGLSVLCVSGDAVLLAELCTRVIVLARGRVATELRADALTERAITTSLLASS